VPAAPDVIVESVTINPSAPAPGSAVTFTAVVRNIGGEPTPANQVIGVSFRVDGSQVTWGTVPGPLAAGASVTVPVTGGSWSATAGTHQLVAVADDVDRFAEADEGNNAFAPQTLEVQGPTASAGGRFGMNIDPANPAGNPSAVELRAAGVRWARVEYKRGFGFAYYDSVLADLRAGGIKVMLIVDYASVAGAPGSDGGAAWNPYIDDFTAGVGLIAQHYGDNVDAWQIWNEPDLLHPGQPYDPGVPAAKYGRMLRDAGAAISQHSSRPIVTAGLASGNPGYLSQAIAAAGGLFADYVAVHPYGQREPDGWPRADWGFGNMTDLFDAYLSFGRPLWVTEIGTVDAPLGADYLENVYAVAASYGADVLRVFWFCWSDGMVPPFGIRDGAGGQKDAYQRYRDIAGAW
jgi:hypothetical protein